MNVGLPRSTGCTFRVLQTSEKWQVSRDDRFYGEFHTRGDAVRAACLGARNQDRHGGESKVLIAPGDRRVPHYQPHFPSEFASHRLNSIWRAGSAKWPCRVAAAPSPTRSPNAQALRLTRALTFAPRPSGAWKMERTAVCASGFACLGFRASRFDRFWPLAMDSLLLLIDGGSAKGKAEQDVVRRAAGPRGIAEADQQPVRRVVQAGGAIVGPARRRLMA